MSRMCIITGMSKKMQLASIFLLIPLNGEAGKYIHNAKKDLIWD